MAQARADLDALGTQVAFVHMQTPEVADHWLSRFGLADVARFSDPDHALYHAFGLAEGSLRELGHPRGWARWLRAALRRGAGHQGRHWRQRSGAFVVRGGDVLVSVSHTHPSARPDYVQLVREALTGHRR